jgi:hypothetical protein
MIPSRFGSPGAMLIALGALSLVVSPRAEAGLIIEAEANGTAVNNFIGTAQAVPGSAFDLAPGTYFPNAAPAHPAGFFFHAQVQGRNGPNGTHDVDFFAFGANGGRVYIDMDNTPSSFDTFLALFDAGGTMLARRQLACRHWICQRA